VAIVKTSTIPDSNVLLDLIMRDPVWFNWSASQMRNSREKGRLVINAVVFAESSAQVDGYGEFQKILAQIGIDLEECPWEAAYQAGRTHLAYRKSGGTRVRVLPDFLIGAHAKAKGYSLLTRDAARYRSYFPELEIIAPDTHP
jgi:predicted nucleic acid-binding protein